MRIDVYHHDSGAAERLTRIEAKLANILMGVNKMNDIVAEVNAKVSRMEVVVTGTATVLGEIKVALDDAISAGSLEALKAVSVRISTLTDTLAAAATAADITPGTPVEPPVEPPAV